MEVSAKSNINVEKAFFSLATDIKKRIVDTSGKPEPSGGAAGGNSVSVGGANGGVAGMQKACCSG